METFYDYITHWQPFFSCIATVAATLVGLLFVSLSINRDKITTQENRLQLRSAKRSFGDFLFVLFIALMFLMPNHHPFGLALSLFCVAIVRSALIVLSMRSSAADSLKVGARVLSLPRLSFDAFLTFGLIAAGVQIYREKLNATFLFVPVVALLLLNGSMNAFQLLIFDEKARVN